MKFLMDVIVSKGMSIKELKEDQILSHLEKEGIEFTSIERYEREREDLFDISNAVNFLFSLISYFNYPLIIYVSKTFFTLLFSYILLVKFFFVVLLQFLTCFYFLDPWFLFFSFLPLSKAFSRKREISLV